MSALTRRESRGFLPDLLDWMESPFAELRAAFAPQPIRVEEYVKDGRYVIRAELPGVDPEKQIEITMSNGMLTIRAERQEEYEGRYHSEFRYGAFSRQIALPASADDQDVKAAYSRGVLEVSAGLKEEADQPPRQIPVTRIT